MRGKKTLKLISTFTVEEVVFRFLAGFIFSCAYILNLKRLSWHFSCFCNKSGKFGSSKTTWYMTEYFITLHSKGSSIDTSGWKYVTDDLSVTLWKVPNVFCSPSQLWEMQKEEKSFKRLVFHLVSDKTALRK